MSNGDFDLLVIGGGITGAGIALDAASRGLKTALIEMQDFASGTSGKSTKLIHGGLRYLKQLEIKLVAEVAKERELLHKNAPQLSIPEKMLLPPLSLPLLISRCSGLSAMLIALGVREDVSLVSSFVYNNCSVNYIKLIPKRKGYNCLVSFRNYF